MQKGQRTALLSVYDKTGIVDFARRLVQLGWNLLASGGTAKHLAEAGVSVTDIATMVGEPILGHRVVTLSRQIHAGLLAKNTPADQAELDRLGIPRIDLVYVNLYPLEQEIAKPDATLESVLEKMDIGGPTLLSAASKGQRIVVANPADMEVVLNLLEQEGNLDVETPLDHNQCEFLAAEADFIVSRYRALTAEFRSNDKFVAIHGELKQECPYGENPYQKPAGFYSFRSTDPIAIDRFELVGGSAPSYNNFCHLDRLIQTMTHIVAGRDLNNIDAPYLAVVVKHGNACGAAWGSSAILALQRMIAGDRLAITGGLVMTNFPIDLVESETLLYYGLSSGGGDSKRLLDAVIAPNFSDEAIELLSRKKGKCRLLKNEHLAHLNRESLDQSPIYRPVRGGFLRQPNYTFVPKFGTEEIVCHGKERPDLIADLVLAWAVGSTSNSNTITIANEGKVIGNGVGQMDRVGASDLATNRAYRAGHDIQGSVAYSDSFFPFPDGPLVLAKAGVKAIFATSGSINDPKVIGCCVSEGIALYLVSDVVGRGFFRE